MAGTTRGTEGPDAAGRRSDGSTDVLCARPKCGKRFSPYRSTQRYCSSTCRKRAWEERRTLELVQAIRDEVVEFLDGAIERGLESSGYFNPTTEDKEDAEERKPV